MAHTHVDGTTHRHDRDYDYDDDVVYSRDSERENRSWLPGLLMIPLLLLAGLGVYGAYQARDNNDMRQPNSAAVQDVRDNNDGTRVGIGGAPNTTVTPTVTVSPTRMPSMSPTMSPSPTITGESRITDSTMDTESDTEIGIGGSPGNTDDDTMPYSPPGTGMGGMSK